MHIKCDEYCSIVSHKFFNYINYPLKVVAARQQGHSIRKSLLLQSRNVCSVGPSLPTASPRKHKQTKITPVTYLTAG